MKDTIGLVKVLLIVLVIPVIGSAVSFLIISDINLNQLATDQTLTTLCDDVSTGKLGREAIAELPIICQDIALIELLGQGSILAAIIGVLIPLMYKLASKYTGESRTRVAAVFPLVLRFSILLIAASVILQGAVLTYAAFIGEAYVIGRVHFWLIAPIGFGALIGGMKLIRTALSFGRKLEMNVIGKVLNSAEVPKLFNFVQLLSEKLGAKAPDNIIVGLEPTFYVTSSEIRCPAVKNDWIIDADTQDKICDMN